MRPQDYWRRPTAAAWSVLLVVSMGVDGAGAGTAPVATVPALGRVFLTPEQRRVLDAQRSSPASTGDPALPRDLLPARAVAGRRVVLNGVIRRRDRGPVVWINGREVDAAALTHGGLQMRHGPDAQNRVTLEARDGGATAQLKPGQSWDPASGAVTECAQCGAPPAPAAPVEPTPVPAKPADASAAAAAPGPAVAVTAATQPGGGRGPP